jgi:hypothetical protein
MLATSDCDGSGTCTQGTPTACPGNLICASATACKASCTTGTDCDTGFYCNAGTCAALMADGAACASNAVCTSMICGTAGSGNCCHAACHTSDTTCRATACDSSGACTYPPKTTACGTNSCTGNMLTTSDCDGSGTCTQGTPTACPGNLICASATACKASCSATSDCTSGWCSDGTCMAVLTDGTACSENDSCSSGVCGINGAGRCCHVGCDITDQTCRATACDSSGACTYPGATTACGAPPSCNSGLLVSDYCNGAGLCQSNGGVACPNNEFCDTVAGECCAAIASGGTVSIDNAMGSDVGCCGYGAAGPCQTLTRAMQLINGTNNLNSGSLIALLATVDGGGGDWANNETYPVVLSWGVTLSAAGVYFNDLGFNAELFDVTLGSGEDAGNPVTIGVPTVNTNDQVVIGSDSLGTPTSDPIGVNVGANETLNILNAQVMVPHHGHPIGVGINVGTSATLYFDQNNTNHGPADLYLGGTVLPNGTPLPVSGVNGQGTWGYGIKCNGTVTDNGSTSTATSSVIAQAQEASIDAEDGCTLSLMNFPQFGTPSEGGFSNAESVADGGAGCVTYPPLDDYGVLANGNGAIVTLEGAQFTCFIRMAIKVTWTSDTGTAPAVTIGTDYKGDVPLISNSGFAGIYANAGTVTVKSGTITHNANGIDMEIDGNGNSPDVNLNDGTMTNNTTVTCSSYSKESGSALPGFDVFNDSAGNVAADYVNWDQWYTPSGTATATTDFFWCVGNPGNSTTCTCEVFDSTGAAACVNTSTDDYDLVLGGDGGTPTGTETSANGAQAAGHCS